MNAMNIFQHIMVDITIYVVHLGLTDTAYRPPINV